MLRGQPATARRTRPPKLKSRLALHHVARWHHTPPATLCCAGALAGNPFGVDRQFLSRELGFEGRVCPNSMDAGGVGGAPGELCGMVPFPIRMKSSLHVGSIVAVLVF